MQKEGQRFVTFKDEATGNTVQVPIENGSISGDALQKLGLTLYDPGYINTAPAKSAICFIDGDQGILEYRGYPLEELCDKCTFLDVAHLLIVGHLPNEHEASDWRTTVMTHTMVHEDLLRMIHSFRFNAHPMGQLVSCVAALSTFHPEANPSLQGSGLYKSPQIRRKQIMRLLGKMPTIAAAIYRHQIGRAVNYPDTTGNLSYVENFIMMLDRMSESQYQPDPRLVRALEVLFIIHADHEFNCSTSAVRHLSSSGVDPFTAISGGIGALYGPLHGGANEAVVRMLERIGTPDRIPEFLAGVKAKKEKLMGFGHRVYKNYDPRARIIKRHAQGVFELLGHDPLMTVALELEKQALADPYFVDRKLFPNVDFYSGLIYKAMGFPTDMFPVLFAIPRTAGWLAHWAESLDDPDTRILRPQQVYIGSRNLHVPDQQPGTDRADSTQRKVTRFRKAKL